MDELIKDVLKRIDSYSVKNIEITPYCRQKMNGRNIEESLLVSTLFSKTLYYIQEQLKPHKGEIEKRHKLVFKISSKYSLIIVVAFYPKVLKIVNAIKTSKELSKLWKNKMSK